MADPSRTASVGDGLDGLKRVGLPASAHQRLEPVRPPFFSQHLAGHLDLELRFRQELLKPAIFGFKLFQALRVRDAHPAELAPPEVVTGLREPVPAAQVLHREACLGLPQEPDDLRFVNRFFTPDLPFRMIGLSTEVLLKMEGDVGSPLRNQTKSVQAYHAIHFRVAQALIAPSTEDRPPDALRSRHAHACESR